MFTRRGKKVYVIAEIGINHNGSIENCFEMIRSAARAGCGAAKFQHFTAKNLYPKTAGRLDWKGAEGRYSYDIFEAAKKFELPSGWIPRLMRCCDDNRIDFLTSISDGQGLKTFAKRGLRQIKITSYSVTNIPLLEECGRTGLPIIMSTGGATLGEVEKAVCTVRRYHENISILHCSLKYPTSLKDCNLGVIETLRLAFPGKTIGYSDHTREVSDAAVQAVYLGARIIEKHITLDKGMPGPDHFFALEPDELKRMVSDINKAEDALKRDDFAIDRRIYGSTVKTTFPHEAYLRNFAFMTLFASKPIKKGQVIKPSYISILRPGKKARGLEPVYMGLFKKHRIAARANIPAGEPITWDGILG